VLSLPPIINGEHSKITLNTKNVLIEVTATDYTKAIMGLTIIVSGFSLYASKKFEIEQVKIVHPDGKEDVTPHLKLQQITANINYMNKLAGINIPRSDVVPLLTKMGYTVIGGEGDEVRLEVPLFRTGIRILSRCYASL
jgi:phenylalanyl-tRNA synthetase beta chain